MKHFLINLLFIAFISNAYGDVQSDSLPASSTLYSLPDDVASVLKKNASELDPISLVWRRTRFSTLDLKTLVVKIKCRRNYGFLNPATNIFMSQGNKIYQYFSQKSILRTPSKQSPYVYDLEQGIELLEDISERSFDGKNFYNGNGHEAIEESPPCLGIYPVSRMMERINPDVIYQEYTHLIGFKFPNTGLELGLAQQSYPLFLIEHGSLVHYQDKSDEDENCIQVKIKSKDIWSNRERIFKFWLARNYGYAVMRMVVLSLEGQVVQEVVNDDFFKVNKISVYWPKKTCVDNFTYCTIPDDISSTPIFSDTFEIVEILNKKINEKQFDLSRKYANPGTNIGDRTLKDTEAGVQYIVPANPADLDRVIEAALTGKDFIPTPLPSRFAITFRWLLIIAGIAMILYACYTKFIKKTMSD